MYALSKPQVQKADLLPLYSLRAPPFFFFFFLEGVDPADSLYAADATQTAVAFARYQQGWVGYVGNVNGEAGSDRVMVTMCGLYVDDD